MTGLRRQQLGYALQGGRGLYLILYEGAFIAKI